MSVSAALVNRVHTGPCVAIPHAVGLARRERRTASVAGRPRVRLYYLLDGRGRRLGAIPAPEGRPTLGPAAPTIYLRRT